MRCEADGQREAKDAMGNHKDAAKGLASGVIEANSGQDQGGETELHQKSRDAVCGDLPADANMIGKEVTKEGAQ